MAERCDECGRVVIQTEPVDYEDYLAHWMEHYVAPDSPCFDWHFAAEMSKWPTKEEYLAGKRGPITH
jgi:hypothetical protein